MIPLLLPLVSVCIPCAASSPQGSAGAQPIAIGGAATGELPLRHENGRNGAQAVFELEVAQPGTFTATLESLDFDCWLSVEDSGTGSATEDRKSGAYTNAWLVVEAKNPAKLRLKVGAEDDRGGTFTLSILPGRVDPPAAGSAERLRALSAYCEAAAARAGERGETARELSFLGQAPQYAEMLGDLVRAKTLFERYLARAQEKGTDADVARARIRLGCVLHKLGQWADAERILSEALPVAETLLSNEQNPSEQKKLASLICLACDSLGDLKAEFRSVQDALPYRRRCAELAPRLGQPVNESLSQQKLGETLDRVGEAVEARRAIERGVEMAERLKSPEVIAGALSSQARYFSRHGLPADCRRVCERALGLSPSPGVRIELLGTVAGADILLARYEQAAAALNALDSLCQEHGITRYEIPARIDRAQIAILLRDLPRACRLLEEALAIVESSGPKSHRIDVLVDLGLALAESGRVDEAQARYEQALEACELAGDHAREASVLLDLADLQVKLQEYTVALQTEDRAAESAGKAGERALESAARAGRAYVLYLTGDLEDARRIAAEEARALESLEQWDKALDAQDTLARIGLRLKDPAAVEEALRSAECLLAEQGDPRLDTFASAGLRSRFADWGCIAQDLLALRSARPGIPESERAALAAQGWSRAGTWKSRTLLERMEGPPALGGASPGDAEGQRMPRIAPGTALFEYVDGLEKMYAYVAVPGSVRFLEIGDRSPIEERARKFVDDVSRMETGPKAVGEEGAWLHTRLVSPLLGLLPRGTDDLVIVPTPALTVLPFEALVQPGSVPGDRDPEFDHLKYLVDEYCVTYAPSSPVLAALETHAPASRQAHFLVLGDPLYISEAAEAEAEDPALAKRPGGILTGYERLKGTREEANEIARLLLAADPEATDAQRARFLESEGRRSDSMSTNLFDLHVGEGVRAELLRQDLSAYTDVYIAAHGYLDPVDPRRNGLVLSYDAVTEGLFPLEDVIQLHLDADLVVLSACSTARGRIVRGEGVQSMSYAFLSSGARSVVASLWSIKDSSTADVMKSFYGFHLDRGLHPARALRKAKLEFKRLRGERGKGVHPSLAPRVSVAANPYFWAALVYVGAPPGG